MQSRFRGVGWLMLAAMALALPTWAERRALLIGVGDYIYMRDASETRSELPPGDLKGPKNDVVVMRDLLVKKYGFPEANVSIRLDREATEANCRQALKDLAAASAAGDWVLFYYSGHGSRILESNYQKPDQRDEDDGWDETLVCADDQRGTKGYRGYKHLVDDEIGAILGEMQRKGAKVMFVSDSCHSGSVHRSLLPPQVRLRYLPPPDTEGSAGDRFVFTPTRDMTWEAGVKDRAIEEATLLAACRDDEKAADAEFPGVGWHGALTYAMLNVLAKSPPTLTFRELAQQVRQLVSVHFEQTPQLDGGGQDWLVFGGPPTGAPTTVQVTVTVTPTTPPPPPAQDVLYVALQNLGALAAPMKAAIDACPYLKTTTQMAWADRLLVGRTQQGKPSVRLVLLDSTIEAEETGDGVDEIFPKLRPLLLKAYLLKQIARMADSRPELAPEVDLVQVKQGRTLKVRPTAFEPMGRTVSIGDVVQFKVRAQRPCYITLIDIATDGTMAILFPNRYHSANEKVQPATWYTIPSPEMKFEIYADAPTGREMVVAVATEEPLRLDQLQTRALEGEMGEAGVRAVEDTDGVARIFRLRPTETPTQPATPAPSIAGKGFAVAWVVADIVE